ncbi:MAG TPA: hypothetical protein VFZ79_19855 [Acidimicrobiales bacterium]
MPDSPLIARGLMARALTPAPTAGSAAGPDPAVQPRSRGQRRSRGRDPHHTMALANLDVVAVHVLRRMTAVVVLGGLLVAVLAVAAFLPGDAAEWGSAGVLAVFRVGWLALVVALGRVIWARRGEHR